jgi:hypothetical protein
MGARTRLALRMAAASLLGSAWRTASCAASAWNPAVLGGLLRVVHAHGVGLKPGGLGLDALELGIGTRTRSAWQTAADSSPRSAWRTAWCAASSWNAAALGLDARPRGRARPELAHVLGWSVTLECGHLAMERSTWNAAISSWSARPRCTPAR